MKKNSKEILVSVIIPCYNAENYIRKCIDSILGQSFKNFELICVNDGSTDSTLDILNEYEKNNSNMLVISKKNEGGKNVTKTGLKYAKGKYICAIDNDDYIHKDYLKKLYNAINKNNSDIAVCGFQREDYTTGKVFSVEMNNIEGEYTLSDDYGIILEVNTSMWNKMFSRDIITKLLDYKLDALGLGDMIQLSYIYSSVNKITFIKDILYFYQVREGSNITGMKSNVINTIYDDLIKIKKNYVNNKPEMINIIDAYAFLHLGVSLMYRMYKSEKKNFNNILVNNTKILNDTFPNWKKNEYYKLSYVIKNHGRNFKLYICYKFYTIKQFKLFLKLYDFITTKFKFDIKW